MSKFFLEDTCALASDPSILGLVEQTWHDVDNEPFENWDDYFEHSGLTDRIENKFFKSGRPPRGFVLVAFIHPYSGFALISEESLLLIDRAFSIGDVVKKRLADAESGTVIRTSVSCTVQPLNNLPLRRQQPRTFPAASPIHQVPAEELEFMEKCSTGNYIIYQDWVGTIREIEDEVTIRLENGTFVTVEIADELREPAVRDAEPKKPWEPLDLLYLLKRGPIRYKSIPRSQDREQDLSCRFFYPGQSVVTKRSNLRRGKWIYGAYDPAAQPRGTIVDVRQVAIDVTWLSPNVYRVSNPQPPKYLRLSEVHRGGAVIYDSSKTPKALNNSSLIGSQPGSNIASGDFMRFKDPTGAALKYSTNNTLSDGRSQGKFDSIPKTMTQGFDMNVVTVRETHFSVIVQWQDASTTEEDSISLSPYLNVDDHDLWPGDVVILKEDEKLSGTMYQRMKGSRDAEKPDFQAQTLGVVQSVDSRERLAYMRWFENSKIEIAGEDRSVLLPSSVFGNISNNYSSVSFYDVMTCPALSKRRGDIVLVNPSPSYISSSTASSMLLSSMGQGQGQGQSRSSLSLEEREQSPSLQPPDITNTPSSDSAILNWFGEIIDLRLDGLVTVRLGALNEVLDIKVPIQRVIVLVGGDDDSIDSNEDGETYDWTNDIDSIPSDEWGPMTEEQRREYEAGDDFDDEMWTTDEEAPELDENPTPSIALDDGLDSSAQELVTSECASSEIDRSSVQPPTILDTTDTKGHANPENLAAGGALDLKADGEESKQLDELHFTASSTGPSQFSILETDSSLDHHFHNTSVNLTANLMRRIQKEYAILGSSLPDGVYVRTWESRLDLLRVLIIGPRDTPYELAPFVLDFQFGSNFPLSPPDSFFHSWTDGIGRVNPNLYEDGKICLSLLGTWPGERQNESWSANSSSMLQIIVSMMGLVLVKEPYYNEAGFDVLIDTEDSKVASALYTEKAFVLARGFLRSAFTHRLGGIDDIIDWLYLSSKPGPHLLRRIVEESNALIPTSMAEQSNTTNGESDTSRRLSAGALVLLRRTMLWLEKRLEDDEDNLQFNQ